MSRLREALTNYLTIRRVLGYKLVRAGKLLPSSSPIWRVSELRPSPPSMRSLGRGYLRAATSTGGRIGCRWSDASPPICIP